MTAEDYYRLGLRLLDEGNPSEALHYLRQAEEEMDQRYEVQVAVGRALAELGERAEASAYFRRCIQETPDRPEAYMAWSELCRRAGQKEESRKLAAFGKARGGEVKETPREEIINWTPEATAPKPGDFAFFCPKCEQPIQHGAETPACPGCRQNLMPILHGHITYQAISDGQQEFRCAQCRAWLNGKEYICPECDTNLMTGELAEPKAPAPKRGLRTPAGMMMLFLGILLLFIGIGQFGSASRRQEAAQVMQQVVQRVTHGTSEGVRIMMDTSKGPNDAHQRPDSEMLWMFAQYFGAIMIGGLVLFFGWMKIHFDRLN
ncbi:MAG: tetratricopeptide repeat protein [Armatimonadetes bacterium]|nr:tetratricopeptide repeat protein [Armatimonadota bacterium]